MKLSFKCYYKFNSLQQNIINELSFHTTKLYNIANYNCRENKYIGFYTMRDLYKNSYHQQFLYSQSYQQVFKVLDQNWKSYFASIKDYKKYPSKYKGQPRPPKFKNINNKKNEVIFDKQGIRFKNDILMLSLSKEIQNKFQVKSLNFNINNIKMPDIKKIKQIRLAWDNSNKRWYINFLYERDIIDITKDYNNIMSIDLGLNNLATITFDYCTKSYIIDGKYAKSRNSYYNKEIAKLTSIAMKQQGNPKYFKRTKKIINLQYKRNNFIKDYIHKASKKIIDIAIINECKEIIIGDFSGVKQNNTAKSFVQIPQQRLVDMIKYKAKLIGIKVVMQNESYTSGCSCLDLEEINKKYYNKSRRVYRGLFISNKGILINADINGSINIMKKRIKCIPRSLQMMMDNGFVDNPIRLRVA
mgnify:CR=1 FL=1